MLVSIAEFIEIIVALVTFTLLSFIHFDNQQNTFIRIGLKPWTFFLDLTIDYFCTSPSMYNLCSICVNPVSLVSDHVILLQCGYEISSSFFVKNRLIPVDQSLIGDRPFNIEWHAWYFVFETDFGVGRGVTASKTYKSNKKKTLDHNTLIFQTSRLSSEGLFFMKRIL